MSTGFPTLMFDSRLADAAPVASTTAAGYAAANVTDLRNYTWHKPTALPMTMRVDCGSAKAADFAAVFGHNLFTAGATFEVRGSSNNWSTDTLVASNTPTDDKPFMLQWASVSYRYWEYRITGGATMPAIAIALIGAALVLPKRMQAGFDPVGQQLVGQLNLSVKGNPLGKIIEYAQFKSPVVQKNVSWDWARTVWKAAWDSNLKGNPHLFAWDPGEHGSEIMLVNCGDKYSAPHQGGGLATLTYDISGVAL